MSNFATMSQEELGEQIKKIIARDSARLNYNNPSLYPGKTISPMSSLTQRAQALEEQRSQKGTPYTNSLRKIANKPNEGISPDNLQTMLGDLQNKHTNFGQNVIGGRLTKQFGQAFDPYRDRFDRKLNKDTVSRLGETKGDIENLNSAVKNFESRGNEATFNAVSNSSQSKNARSQRLIGDLYGYGQQKQGINNKILTGDKARFEAEKNEPYERLHNLQRVLDGTNADEDDPELSIQNAQNLKKALIAYGVDIGKPVEQWGQGDSNHIPTYRGRLVEPLNSDMNTSYGLAESINPSYQDKDYDARKTLRKELVNDPSHADKFIPTLQDKLDPRFNLLNLEAKKKAKADMTALNAKYIKRGMYGGQSHINSASDRMREINDATFGARSKVLENELGTGIVGAHKDNINKVHKLNQYDQLANSEFNNMLGDVKRTNTTGLEKWKNDQAGNEQLYKSYQNEKNLQQPRLLGNARETGINAGIGGMFNHFDNQGVDLTSISDLQNRYNNLEKEQQATNQEIKNRNDYEVQRRAVEHAARIEALNRRQTEQSRANAEWYRQNQLQEATYRRNIENGSFFANQNNPPNILSTTGGYGDTADARILNHPEILKRRMLNSQFNDINYSRDWLRRSGYNV